MIFENKKTVVDVNKNTKRDIMCFKAMCYMFLIICLRLYPFYFYVIDSLTLHSFHDLFLQETPANTSQWFPEIFSLQFCNYFLYS